MWAPGAAADVSLLDYSERGSKQNKSHGDDRDSYTEKNCGHPNLHARSGNRDRSTLTDLDRSEYILEQCTKPDPSRRRVVLP